MMDSNDVVLICKALSDANRLKILQVLLGGEKCVCVLYEYLNVTQPTLSHHMKVLAECRLVTSRRAGKWIYYRIDEETFNAFKKYFADLHVENNSGCCCGNGDKD